ncbi:MAG: HPr(Ser) kinase/phosphatase [Lachnospiraceae bacterium]|nr:HPr(Ser) kinase/phosphatase [Lachnospiraceae bacterium]
MYSVDLNKIADILQLRNLTPQVSLEGVSICYPEVNRPALQLAGYYEYFASNRIQAIGNVEYYYLMSLNSGRRQEVLDHLFSTGIPCLVLCRGITDSAEKNLTRLAIKYNVPVLGTDEDTMNFCSRVLQYLNVELAPRESLHGVMMDCYGEGVLIIGESGFGKSETALELVQRGHRLVADDVVEIRRINDRELLAEGVDMIRNMLELRGVGIINVKDLYGVQAVRLSKNVDMVIRLEPWDPEKQYDRRGLNMETINILGNEVTTYVVPLMAGRNVAMIIETAALNHREKKMGYNAAEDLRQRAAEVMARKKAGRK